MIAHSSILLFIDTLQVSKHSTAVEDCLENVEPLGLKDDKGEDIGLTMRSEFNFLIRELFKEERGIQILIVVYR
jgi:hypothetical protein